MFEPSSPVEYKSVSIDNEELAGVNNLQLQDPLHFVRKELISYVQMVQLPPKVGEAGGPFP